MWAGRFAALYRIEQHPEEDWKILANSLHKKEPTKIDSFFVLLYLTKM